MEKILLLILVLSGTRENPEYDFVNDTKDWSSAQAYCRQNYTDLATVRSETDWQMIYSVASVTQNSWIGLYRDSNIFWSDRSSFFPNKTRFPLLLWPNNSKCVFYYTAVSNRWRFAPCNYGYAFVCYSFAPVKKYSVKIRLKTNNPGNLNDPAVKTEILKKFQKDLTDKGVSGVELKWTEQRDGNVFKKENNKGEL